MKVAFLGAGGINRVHARAVRLQPDVELSAVCTRDGARAATFARDLGVTAWYTDFGEMLDRSKPDVLYVAIPPGAHSGEAEEAARRGVHLMLEKPIALTMERAESIRRAVHEAGIVCQVGFHLRHTPVSIRLKALIERGAAGRPLSLSGSVVTDSLYSAWWRSAALGGGQLVEQAIHLYDLARYFLGEPVTVAALVDNLGHRQVPDYEVDDVSASVTRFSSGAIASITSSNCGGRGQGRFAATVQFERVVAEIDNAGGGALLGRHEPTGAGAALDDAEPTPLAPARTPYEELAANVVAAVRGETAPRATVEDGVEALRFVLAARRSALDGAIVGLL